MKIKTVELHSDINGAHAYELQVNGEVIMTCDWENTTGEAMIKQAHLRLAEMAHVYPTLAVESYF